MYVSRNETGEDENEELKKLKLKKFRRNRVNEPITRL